MSDLICIGFDNEGQKRVNTAAEFLQVKSEFYKSSDDVFEKAEQLQPRFILVSAIQAKKKEDIAGEVQVLRQFYPETFIGIVAEKKMQLDDARFVKKSGCNYLFLENDFFTTTRLEYVMLQIVNAAYLPLKVADLKLNSVVDFHVYTIMPLNQKILPVVQPGTTISEARLAKLSAVDELYVKRNQIELYAAYLAKNPDLSAKGLANRCRAQFHSVATAHSNLVFLLTDQAEAGSYDQGKILLKQCLDLCKNLLETLAVLPEPWSIISQSTFGMLGGTDRSMMIASMAAVASFATELGSAEDVMLAGLFCDLALLELSPKSLGKLDTLQGREQMTPEDIDAFQKHPVASLNRLLESKMQISEAVKKIILCTHEQNNKKGFPKQTQPEKLPPEAALILFHEMVDLEYRMTLGKQRESYPEVRKRVYDRENKHDGAFSYVFLEKMKEYISS